MGIKSSDLPYTLRQRIGLLPPDKPKRAKRGSVKAARFAREQAWSLEQRAKTGIFLGVQTVSEMNMRDDHYSRHSRKKLQQGSFYIAVLAIPRPTEPIRVRMIRLGPRRMDDDNLASSFKHLRDAVAKWVGVDDGEAFYEWVCEQEKHPFYGVRIVIERKDNE